MTFEQLTELTELLDQIDEECLAEYGETLGLGVCGTKHALKISFGCVLWDSENDPDDPGELKQHLLGALRELVAGLKTAVAALEGRGDEEKEPEAEPKTDAEG